jgi:flagellar hook assembly protein FlgD
VKNELKNIDQLFKETFDGFEADVDPSVWTNIQGVIAASSGSASVVGKSIALKVTAGILALGALAGGVYFASTYDSSPESETAVNAPITNNTLTTAEIIVAELQEKQAVDEAVVKIVSPAEERIAVPNKKNRVERPSTKNTVQHQKSSIEEGIVADATISKRKTAVASSEKENSSVEKTVEESHIEPQVVVKKAEIEKEAIQDGSWEEDARLEKEKRSPSIDQEKIPRKFSPNGDGIGDLVTVQGRNIKKFHATILSTSNGKVIFEWFLIEGFWDGRDLLGNKVSKGTYMLQVVASGEDGKPILVNQSITVY